MSEEKHKRTDAETEELAKQGLKPLRGKLYGGGDGTWAHECTHCGSFWPIHEKKAYHWNFCKNPQVPKERKYLK